MNELLDVLLLRSGYNSALVIFAASALGVACGVIGCFTLLRKRALMGDALAHSALPGLVLAFIFATVILGKTEKSLPLLLAGAALSGILGVAVIHGLSHYTRLAEDTAIGAVLSVFFGAGVVLLSIVQSMDQGSAGGLSHFIYGQTAAIRLLDAQIMLAACILTLAGAALFFKEFSVLCFDPEFARVQGWPVTQIDLMMMALLTLVAVVGFQAVGMILIVSLLIIPPAAARFWTERLRTMLIVSACIGGASGYLGAVASTLLPRLPAGAVIVLAQGCFFILSLLFAPERGVCVGLLRRLSLKMRVRREHLLREVYEFNEGKGKEASEPISLSQIELLQRSLRPLSWFFLLYLRVVNLVQKTSSHLSLTKRGQEEALRVLRNHRLWEQYLFEYAAMESSHVDYSADYVEHVLSPEVVQELEEGLRKKGLLPLGLSGAPTSIHPLAAASGDSSSGIQGSVAEASVVEGRGAPD